MPPNIVTIAAVFNVLNGGYCYMCKAEDGTAWMRSTTGNWARVDAEAVRIEDIQADIKAFFLNKNPIPVIQALFENTTALVVPPLKAPVSTETPVILE